MSDQIPTTEYLTELLNKRDDQIGELQDERERLRRELDGSLNGWRTVQEVADGPLPHPRLELAYIQNDEWRDYTVVYRLIMQHFLGELLAIPLGSTRCSSGINREPDALDLPFRDGAHAIHDSAYFKLPLYKIMPGRDPVLIREETFQHATEKGIKHRKSGER